jgi:endonuclease YncB( thermonuclease family)
VIDGDTLEIHGTRIRLWGIDAPESTQLCRGEDSLQYRYGAKAANELDAFIARRPVNWLPVSLDQYRRTVAVCSIDGVDLAEWLVRNGLALDWPTYSKAGMIALSVMRSTRGEAFGKAATLNRGCFALASGKAEGRAIVRMMLTCILSPGTPMPTRMFFDLS